MSGDDGAKPRRRFLVEVRGVLHVEATDGTAAERIVDDWIALVGNGDSVALPTGMRVGYLRVYPESDDAPGWPPRATDTT